MSMQARWSAGLLAALLFVFLSMTERAVAQAKDPRPNVLLIVADDIGTSDLGVFGGEIDTPNLDRLAREGVQLTNFHVSPACSPTRAMLMSGVDSHLAGLGNMLEQMAPAQEGRAGYEGVLNGRVVTLAELLRDAGYHTYMAGKWHLGGKPEQGPHQRGFERAWYLAQAGSAHFVQESPSRLFNQVPEPFFRENGTEVERPADFYSTAFFTDKLIEYIDEGRADRRPFFAYAAYTAPHRPLQAPDEYLAKYLGRYDAGYDAIAAARLERLKQLGLVAKDAQAAPRPPTAPAWADLTAEERVRSARTMEAYAAMVDAFDHHVGRLLAHLGASGQLTNTFVLFFSDNGPEGNDILQDWDSDTWIPANFDNSLENMGRRNSYVFQGEAWGQVSAQPCRLYKGFTTEGGIRVPAFAWYPKALKAGRSDTFTSVLDVMPTLLALAATSHPGIAYKERPIFPMQDMSALGHLRGEAPGVHNPDHVWGVELFGRRALRKGEWKIVYDYPPLGEKRWRLHHLAVDPQERNDLSVREPEKLSELLLEYEQYSIRNNVVPLDQDYGYPRKNY
jgi:arylsulfatase A-like enzyme